MQPHHNYAKIVFVFPNGRQQVLETQPNTEIARDTRKFCEWLREVTRLVEANLLEGGPE
jgi:hypothetical protein